MLDDSLNSFATNVEDLIELLKSGCNVAISWFIENKMLANPDKFQAILLDKQNSDYTAKLTVGFEEIQKVDRSHKKRKDSLEGIWIKHYLMPNLILEDTGTQATSEYIKCKH